MFKTFKRFKQDIECVVEPIDGKGGIFIGNLEAAENINILKKNQIKTIFTAADRIILSHSEEDIPYYKQIPAKDYDQFDLKKYFDESVEFIDKSVVKGNVLVHCGAGISRSAAIVLAYLIKKKGMSYQQAYNEVKSKRAIIQPNGGFIKQLKIYSTQFDRRQFSPQHKVTLNYLIYQQKQQKQCYSPLKKYQSTIHQYSQSPVKYRCQSPVKKYQSFPLRVTNRFSNPQIMTKQTYSSIKSCSTLFSQKTRQQIDNQIAQIKRKYSQPQSYSLSNKFKSNRFIQNLKTNSFSITHNSLSSYDKYQRRFSNYYDYKK